MNDAHERPTTDLAMQLLHDGKVEECLHCLDRIVQAYPDNALAYSIMGAAYAKSGEKGMAIASFERAVAEEETARARANLGKAYEAVGRTKDAVMQYEHAVQLEPGYQQAVDGLQRLKPPEEHQEVTQQIDPHHQLHQLAGDDSTPSDPGGLRQVAIPVAAPPPPAAPGRVPDLRDLEYRARQTDEKARAVQKKMLKSGLIYGVIVGPIGLMGAVFLLRMFLLIGSPAGDSVIGAIIGGIVLGLVVGGWVGYTSGDETTGLKVGALVGAVGQALLGITGGWVTIIIFGVSGAVIGGAAGYFIGMMVTHSIGWD